MVHLQHQIPSTTNPQQSTNQWLQIHHPPKMRLPRLLPQTFRRLKMSIHLLPTFCLLLQTLPALKMSMYPSLTLLLLPQILPILKMSMHPVPILKLRYVLKPHPMTRMMLFMSLATFLTSCTLVTASWIIVSFLTCPLLRLFQHHSNMSGCHLKTTNQLSVMEICSAGNLVQQLFCVTQLQKPDWIISLLHPGIWTTFQPWWTLLKSLMSPFPHSKRADTLSEARI